MFTGRFTTTEFFSHSCFHNGYDFISQEHGAPPSLCNTAAVFTAFSIVVENGLRDYLGQCEAPMFTRLPGFCYERQVCFVLTIMFTLGLISTDILFLFLCRTYPT